MSSGSASGSTSRDSSRSTSPVACRAHTAGRLVIHLRPTLARRLEYIGSSVGPGFYFNNALTVFAMFVFVYLTLFSHILQLDRDVPNVDLLNAQWTIQFGLLLTVPIVCFLAVEHGLRAALARLWKIYLTGIFRHPPNEAPNEWPNRGRSAS